MSGSTTAADIIRGDVATADELVYAPNTLASDGSQSSVSGSVTAGTYLTIDTVGSVGVSADLFLGTGFSLIENVNDTSPIVVTGSDTGTDTASSELVYQGDAAGQTFYAGTGSEFAAMTGFGNVFAAPATGGGTYEVSAGLLNAGTDLLTLAAAPSVGSAEMGNTIVAASGDASIAAGLGDNAIFLGSGTALVANEGADSIIGGTGSDTINGAGTATIFASTGSTTEYDGAGGSALIVGSTVAGAGALNVYGGSGSVSVYGGSTDVSAFGGTAGNNVLVSGSGNSSLVGGGNNDLLVASGAGTSTLVAGAGNETLFGGGASGTTNFFLGSGNDTVVAGTGNEYLQFGAGLSTVFGSTGHDVYGVLDSVNGGTNLVVGFDASQDFISLQGFDSSITGSSVMANDVNTANGSSIITLSTGTVIDLYGVTNLTAANFVVPTNTTG